MEQNLDTSAPIAPVTENNEQNGGGNGLKIATAIACIVAVCGIGFGVYGMVQSSQKDNQIVDLEKKVAERDKIIASMNIEKEEEQEEQNVEQKNSDESISRFEYEKIINDLHVDISLDSDRYMEIVELGVKIKLPNISNSITYEKYVSELGDVFYDIYSDGEPTNLSVFYVPETAGAVPDTTIYFDNVDGKTYAIALKDYTATMKPPLSTLIYFFKNSDEVFVKL